MKEEIVRYLQGMEPGDSVDVVTFDRGVRSRERFQLVDEAVRRRAIAHVSRLEAEGSQTWVYSSVLGIAEDVLGRNRKVGSPELPTVFFVFTDGRDNQADGRRMAQLLDELAPLIHQRDYFYYVTLGVDLPAEDKSAFDRHPNAVLVENPAGKLARQGLVEIRARLLDFGFVEGDASSQRSLAPRTLNVEDGSVQLRITARFEAVELAGAVVETDPDRVESDGSAGLRLRIINRESLPDAHYEGWLELGSESRDVRIMPDRVPARFSTLEEPLASIELHGDASELDYGEVEPVVAGVPEAVIRVEFNRTAVEEGARLRAWIEVANGERPGLVWNGLEVGASEAIEALEPSGELRLAWPALPPGPEDHRGEIHLAGLELRGNALSEATESGSRVISYRLRVLRPPMPWWRKALLGCAILLALLLVASTVAWALTRQPPWRLLRAYLLLAGAIRPRLRGKLVHDRPGGDRAELRLRGSGPIGFGPEGQHWPTLPAGIEVEARLRKGKEVVVARRTQGEVTLRPRSELKQRSLSGQALGHRDALVLSDGTEILFIDYSD